MLSLEIIGTFFNLSNTDIIQQSNIPKSTFYLIKSGKKPVSQRIINKMAKNLAMPYLPDLIVLDQLYRSNIKAYALKFPDTIPVDLQAFIYDNHPIFVNNWSKYNRLGQNKQN